MSGRFLDIPNEKIAEDFKALGILPTTGKYYRGKDKYGDESCCPITCQLASGGVIDLAAINEMANPTLTIEDLARDEWPDLNEKDDNGYTNLVYFLHGYDSVRIEQQNPYLKKGRELRRLIFNSDEGAISS